VASLTTPEEFFAADWAMQHYAPLHQLSEGTYQLCFYERLRADGVNEIRRIFDRFILPVPEGLEGKLARPSAKASGLARRGEGGKRTQSVEVGRNHDVMNRILRVLNEFGLDWYDSR
jgi:hypothetical protein